MLKILVVIPLKRERTYFIEALKRNAIAVTALNGPYDLAVWDVPQLGLQILTGGHGKVQCGLTTVSVLLGDDTIGGVICLGGAGALHEALQPGDIVCGSKTVEHDFKASARGQLSLPFFKSSEALLSSVLGASDGISLKVVKGPIASGDEDIVDRERADALYGATGAFAVGWEGAGVGRAARMHGKPFLEIRGITDMAGGDVGADFLRHLEQVMSNLCDLMVTWRKKV